MEAFLSLGFPGGEVQPAPGPSWQGAKLGRRWSLPATPVSPQVEGWGREDPCRRNDGALGEVPPTTSPIPAADPSPVPAPRSQGPGRGQDLCGHRPGRDPGAQLLQGGPCPAALSPGSLRGPALDWGGWSLRAPRQQLLFPPQPVNNADFIIPVEIDGVVHQVRGWVWGGGGGLGICLPDPRLLSPILSTPGGTLIEMECKAPEGVRLASKVTQTLRDLAQLQGLQGVGFLLGTPLPHLARDPVQVIQDRLCAVQPVLHYLARGPVPCSLGVRGLPPGPYICLRPWWGRDRGLVIPHEVGPEARSWRLILIPFWKDSWNGRLAKWSPQALGPASLLCPSALLPPPPPPQPPRPSLPCPGLWASSPLTGPPPRSMC